MKVVIVQSMIYVQYVLVNQMSNYFFEIWCYVLYNCTQLCTVLVQQVKSNQIRVFVMRVTTV